MVPPAGEKHADRWCGPSWSSPVRALMSTRLGGVSAAPFDGMNISHAVGDAPEAVVENRRRFEAALGAPVVWLHLVHGAAVAKVGRADLDRRPLHQADAAWTDEPGVACAVTAADCLPLLMAVDDGRAVAAAHAGWRGLAAGVVEATVAALCEGAGVPSSRLRVWLGPCIGPSAFEVGEDVWSAFSAWGADREAHFIQRVARDGVPKWSVDLQGLAMTQLRELGVGEISRDPACTVSEPSRFFSYRRDGRTGRMVAAIVRLP
ncbi:MAG: peptidoglycan editing factor PgeF [Rubrivivax sp.]